MNLQKALKRIEELERRVKELETRPAQQIHYHSVPAWPVQPDPYYIPQPQWYPPIEVTCAMPHYAPQPIGSIGNRC